MEDVSIRILRERAVLDAAGPWQTGPVRDPAKMAESPVSGSQSNLRRAVEKSPQDVSIGSLPFDPRILSNGRCPIDAGGDEPGTDLEAPEPPVVENPRYDQSVLPTISAEQQKQEEETRQEMETIAPPKLSLVKHNQVKALALELMADRFTFNGKKKFTRVSPQFCESLERFLYAAIVSAIQRHPSSGKVIKDF